MLVWFQDFLPIMQIQRIGQMPGGERIDGGLHCWMAAMSRLSGAIGSICEAISAAADIPIERIDPDDDFIDELAMNALELESLGMIVEEIFAIAIPDDLWRSPIYRTASALAEWAIRQSDQQAWLESQRKRRA
jgi:acyl carrier protein